MTTPDTQTGQSGPSPSFTLGPPAPPGQATTPPRTPIPGQTTTLVPLQQSHAAALYKHLGGDDNRWRWTYMPYAGYSTLADFETAIAAWSASRDPAYYVVLSSGPSTSTPDSVSEEKEEAEPEPAGLLAYTAIIPAFRRVEIGYVILGGPLTRSRPATEAFYLMLRSAFDELGYARVEWKANALNGPSRQAALRLGFRAEGVQRKHMIVKGRFRDTAWFGMTEDEWPVVKRGFETWLDDSNFDDSGKQKRTLKQCREEEGEKPE